MHMLKLFSVLFVSIQLFASPPVNKFDFYSALKSEEKKVLDKEIERLDKLSDSPIKDAYLGALKMKSAQFYKTNADKLAAFKEGKKLLESAILQEPENGEFRFLRLTIQEKSPKILKYSTNIEEDKKVVLNTYPKLDLVVRKAIKSYAEESSIISPKEFS